MDSLNSKSWIKGLDSLRFILAIWVMVSHFGLPLFLENDQLASNKFISLLYFLYSNSFVGVVAVMAFFVISGFVIHLPYSLDKPINIPEFLLKRYLRILIPLISISIIAYFYNCQSELPLWSLYCELFYYTLYPALLFISKKIKWIWQIVITWLICFVIIFLKSETFENAFHISETNYQGNYHSLGVFYTSLIGLPCWLMGVYIAQNLEYYKKENPGFLKIMVLRFTLIITSILCLIGRFHFNISYMLSLSLILLMVAYWVAKEISYASGKNTINWLENGGKWSYSLYISHMLVPALVLKYDLIINNIWIDSIIKFAFALSFSYIFYNLIEKPSHTLAKKIKLTR